MNLPKGNDETLQEKRLSSDWGVIPPSRGIGFPDELVFGGLAQARGEVIDVKAIWKVGIA